MVAKNRVVVCVEFSDENGEAKVEIDSAKGCSISISGTLYPVQLVLVNEIVKAIREKKDNFPFAASLREQHGNA
jgi:hypothetical protein